MIDLLEPAVAKKRRGRPIADVETRPVRVRADIIRKAEWIAVARGVKPGQVISDLVESIINREYEKVEKPKD